MARTPANQPGPASASASSGRRFRWRSRRPRHRRARHRGARGAAETIAGVRQIRIEGATVYTSAQLAELYADLIGHRVTLQAVYDAAGRITAKYGADGYVLSRAIIPVQELDPNGAVVRIQVLEGYVETVENGRPSSPAIAISFPTTRRGSPPNGR